MKETVIITGAATGIGNAIAQQFGTSNWEVIGLDVLQPQGFTDFSQFLTCDLADLDSIQNFCDTIKDQKIGALINNAAIQVEKPLVTTELSEWNRVLMVNLTSVFILSKALHQNLRDGSIVNLSSVHARATSRGLCAYVASKGGVSALTRAMALEFAEFKIRVNAVLPGAIETPMLLKGLGRQLDPARAKTRLADSAPLQQIGSPQDIAKLVWFLANNELSGNITGQEFVCDSGVLACLASETG